MHTVQIKGRSIAMTLAVTLAAFLLVFTVSFPIDYGNEGVEMNWLSASTIKFVNQWLKEGALSHRFTCYESFDSIEFNSLEERTPYLSYPAGTVFSVYTAARICGVTQINLPFVKRFQMVCFVLDTLLLAAFLYLLLAVSLRTGEVFKTLLAAALAIMWALLPANTYFLSNVFFADQYVILWVHLFLLTELLAGMPILSRKKKMLRILECPIIFMGVMTDYYFWILVFLAFLIDVTKNILEKRTFWSTCKAALWYIGPVIAALSAFFLQLSYTKDWPGYLAHKMRIQTGDGADGSAMGQLKTRFLEAFVNGSGKRALLFALFLIVLVALLIRQAVFLKKWKKVFINPAYAGIALGIAAPLLQVFFLKNHSAVHAFSMIKVGAAVILLIPAMTILLCMEKQALRVALFGRELTSAAVNGFLTCAVVFLILGLPQATKNYYNSHSTIADLGLAKLLYETMEYENVCFSFSYEIDVNPPQKLSVSEKQVYRVTSVDEIDAYFPNLSHDAKKVLVIDKGNPYLSQELRELEAQLAKQHEIIYEDERYGLALLP